MGWSTQRGAGTWPPPPRRRPRPGGVWPGRPGRPGAARSGRGAARHCSWQSARDRPASRPGTGRSRLCTSRDPRRKALRARRRRRDLFQPTRWSLRRSWVRLPRGAKQELLPGASVARGNHAGCVSGGRRPARVPGSPQAPARGASPGSAAAIVVEAVDSLEGRSSGGGRRSRGPEPRGQDSEGSTEGRSNALPKARSPERKPEQLFRCARDSARSGAPGVCVRERDALGESD